MTVLRVLVVLLTALVLLPACGGTNQGGIRSGDVEGEWKLVSGVGPDGKIETVDGYPITLALVDGEISGTAACNSYGGSVTIRDDRFAIEQLSKTEMACTAEGVMASEGAYVRALQDVDRIRYVPGRLVLAGRSTELEFERVESLP